MWTQFEGFDLLISHIVDVEVKEKLARKRAAWVGFIITFVRGDQSQTIIFSWSVKHAGRTAAGIYELTGC